MRIASSDVRCHMRIRSIDAVSLVLNRVSKRNCDAQRPLNIKLILTAQTKKSVVAYTDRFGELVSVNPTFIDRRIGNGEISDRFD